MRLPARSACVTAPHWFTVPYMKEHRAYAPARLKSRREELGLSQEDLAARCRELGDTGMSAAVVCRYENARTLNSKHPRRRVILTQALELTDPEDLRHTLTVSDGGGKGTRAAEVA